MVGNVVACCETCKTAKGATDLQPFLERIAKQALEQPVEILQAMERVSRATLSRLLDAFLTPSLCSNPPLNGLDLCLQVTQVELCVANHRGLNSTATDVNALNLARLGYIARHMGFFHIQD